MLSDTDQESEEERAVIDGPGLAGGMSPIWAWFGEQSDVEGEVSQAASLPLLQHPSHPHTLHSARTLAPNRLALSRCFVLWV